MTTNVSANRTFKRLERGSINKRCFVSLLEGVNIFVGTKIVKKIPRLSSFHRQNRLNNRLEAISWDKRFMDCKFVADSCVARATIIMTRHRFTFRIKYECNIARVRVLILF